MIQTWVADTWAWVKDRASKSWTMWGATLLSVASLADTVYPFLPEDLQHTKTVIGMSILFAVLRSRSL